MKKFFLGAIVAACSIMPAKAGRIVTDSIQSKVLFATVKYNIYLRDGGHTWEYWHTALRTALPFASRNFGK